MDLLVEKLDGSRYYLSQYKVLITDFEESAPSVTRNSKQLDQRNGNIDFGGWHTDKTINITGYYRADDIDEEETLREKLYALLSDPDGYYITQLKTTPSVAMERPGETSGNYYDKLSNYPSHKRFLVYTEAPEMELVGNVNGTLLYKLTAEFKTMKLPYGESLPQDLDVKPNVPYYGRNYFLNSDFSQDETNWKDYTGIWLMSSETCNGQKVMTATPTVAWMSGSTNSFNQTMSAIANQQITVSVWAKASKSGAKFHSEPNGGNGVLDTSLTNTWKRYSYVAQTNTIGTIYFMAVDVGTQYWISMPKVEIGTTPTPWSPALEDPEYNEWYFDTYYNTKNLAIPYAGTVPCNQLEQGFTVQFTATGSASSLSFKIGDTELTYNGAVATGDVFLLNGFSYTQNGLSIVSKTNKAYFILQPDKQNRITCNVPGTVKIIGFQNLYA